MERGKIKKQLQILHNSMKSEGVFCINTTTGNVELSLNRAGKSEEFMELEQNKVAKNLNTQFNTLFYERGFPEMISIKYTGGSKFIKFFDSDHIIYAIVDSEEISYPKIKACMNKAVEN